MDSFSVTVICVVWFVILTGVSILLSASECGDRRQPWPQQGDGTGTNSI
jgi:hypothetical protein